MNIKVPYGLDKGITRTVLRLGPRGWNMNRYYRIPHTVSVPGNF